MGVQPFRLTAEEALQRQGSNLDGLSFEEASARLARFGENQLVDAGKKSVLSVFFEQFKDLLVIVLIAAAGISLASGHVESTIVIFAVILLNAVLGTLQTVKAEQSLPTGASSRASRSRSTRAR